MDFQFLFIRLANSAVAERHWNASDETGGRQKRAVGRGMSLYREKKTPWILPSLGEPRRTLRRSPSEFTA